ncbi:FxLYD domain-containing protein [Nocardioides sp. J54]|uniref:FxLYD domain-containing protein n=1 Tax=Nocardioides sp. J54 TaxID=935866 RepID=UPI00048E8F2B|nr:FxLYD domain-containing protein [Nocardioides sp. J54]
MKTLPAAATALVALLALGACGDDEPKGGSTSKGEDTASVDPSRVSPTDLPEVPELKGSKGAVADASFGQCTAAPGEQKVSGTVTNSTRQATDYVVTVSWINETYDVLARGVAVLEDLAAGASEDFEVSASVPEDADTCTFHVARGEVR